MAQTFTLYSNGIAFAATKIMQGIKNLHATEVLKVRRVGLLNAQTAGVTGVVCSLAYNFHVNPTWTTPVTTGATIATHDTTNSAPASYAYGSAGTYSAAAALTLRRTIWSSDEAAASSATSDELECFVPLNILFDAGYGDANVQPLTLRQNDFAGVYNISGAAGLLDVWCEFTKE